MSKKKQQRVTTFDKLLPENDYSHKELTVNVDPRSPAQHEVVDLWPRSRVLFLIGPAGCGKTHISLALALEHAISVTKEHKSKARGKIMLTRPMITVDEPLGFLPGDVEEKVAPWLLPFHDVLGEMSFTKWDDLKNTVDVESVPLGMMRGRTIKNGTLICDEFQNASYEQIKCVLTRIGKGARIVISGDPDQSDCYSAKSSPLIQIARKLYKLDTVSVIKFDAVEDQMRDPLVLDMLALL